MDYEQARFNMVEQQVRTWDVLDQQILDLLFEVKREEFVPAAYRSLAFADLELPLANGARMWAPKLEARVLQELKLKRAESVLEIGTGSGYLAALLCRRAGLCDVGRDRRGHVGDGGRHARAHRHRQRPLRGRRRRPRMGHRTIRCHRAHRFDAAASRGFLPAIEAWRPHFRDCRRRCR